MRRVSGLFGNIEKGPVNRLFGFHGGIFLECADDLFAVHSVNGAGFFDAFHLGCGTADAVHAGPHQDRGV